MRKYIKYNIVYGCAFYENEKDLPSIGLCVTTDEARRYDIMSDDLIQFLRNRKEFIIKVLIAKMCY